MFGFLTSLSVSFHIPCTITKLDRDAVTPKFSPVCFPSHICHSSQRDQLHCELKQWPKVASLPPGGTAQGCVCVTAPGLSGVSFLYCHSCFFLSLLTHNPYPSRTWANGTSLKLPHSSVEWFIRNLIVFSFIMYLYFTKWWESLHVWIPCLLIWHRGGGRMFVLLCCLK